MGTSKNIGKTMLGLGSTSQQGRPEEELVSDSLAFGNIMGFYYSRHVLNSPKITYVFLCSDSYGLKILLIERESL